MQTQNSMRGMEQAKIDMEEFISDIHECCDEIQFGWSGSTSLDTESLKKLKGKLIKFAVSHKGNILHLYDYAKNAGRYQMVYDVDPLIETIMKYESYHDDLVEFIRMMLSSDCKYTDDEKASEHIEKAIAADEKFRHELSANKKDMVFPEAVDNMDAFIALFTFIDKVNDCFIELTGHLTTKEPSERLKLLIDLYSRSILDFLSGSFDILIRDYNELFHVANGERSLKVKEETPQLL